MRKILLLGLVLPVFMFSCKNVDPAGYEQEIEDSVRGELAVAYFVFGNSGISLNETLVEAGSFLLKLGCPRLLFLADRLEGLKTDENNLGNKISRMHDDHGLSYFRTFESLAADTAYPYMEYAQSLKNIYSDLELELTEPELVRRTSSLRRWEFQEKVSGVDFVAEVSGLDGKRPVFKCVAEPESLQRYIDRVGKIRVESKEEEAEVEEYERLI